MLKFHLNLLVQISKAFVYSKIQFLFRNNLSSDSGPAPSSPSLLCHAGRRARARPTRPKQPWHICQKAPLLQVCAVRQRCFLSLSRRCQVGPTHQIHLLPRADRPESRLHHASPQLIAPCLPASIIETLIKAPYSPALIPPLESPLTPPPPRLSMASAVNHRPLLTGISTPSSPGPL
jgi:hypothetical protein